MHSQLMLGLTLVRGFLLLWLWSPPAAHVCPCLSLLAHRKCAKIAGEAFDSYSPFLAHINAYLHMKPCQQRQRLISAPFVSNHMVLRIMPPAIGVRLPDGLSKHNYCLQERDTCRRLGVGELPLTVTTLPMISGRAWGRRRYRGKNVSGAGETVRVDSVVAQKPLPSRHNCADTRRKPFIVPRTLLAGDGSAASLTATVSQRSTSEELQTRPREASCVCSAGAPKEETKVEQHRAPISFTDMLLRQLRPDIPSSSDALNVAFPRRYDRVSFRERLLRNLRQEDIYVALGVTRDSAHREEIMLPDACSKTSSSISQIPQDEAVMPGEKEERKRDATGVAKPGNGKETHHQYTRSGSRNRPVIPRSCGSPFLRGSIRTSGCNITPKNNFVNFSSSACSLKGIDAALSHPGTISEDINNATDSNQTLKGFQRVARESCAAARYPAGGKTHSRAVAGKRRRGRRTASENLRGELGLHHRADIFVQHISDLRRRVRVPRPL